MVSLVKFSSEQSKSMRFKNTVPQNLGTAEESVNLIYFSVELSKWACASRGFISEKNGSRIKLARWKPRCYRLYAFI